MAEAGLRALERGKRTVVPGPTNMVGAVAGRLTPRAAVLEILDRFYPVGK
jgi:short-subunit dehydrogenase